jgi:hypothetical protein
MNLATIFIAQEFDGTVGNKNFWETGLGEVLGSALGVLGILIVIYAIVRTVKNVAQGKIAEALKGVIGAVLLAAVLFNPSLVQNAISVGGKVMERALSTVSEISDSGSSTPSSDSGSNPDSCDGVSPGQPC